MKKIYLIFMLVITAVGFLQSQDLKNESRLYPYAVKLQADGKLDDAMTVFKNLLKSDSSNLNYLQHTSYLYSKLGYLQPTENVKMQWFHTGEYLALKAMKLYPQSADAHYVYALALGRINEHAGNRTKIANAKIIKSEAEVAIRLDPALAGPYHILGKWHQVVAGFNAVERTMIKAMFGGMPGGSYDDAIKNFQKAIALDPTSVAYYELAVSFQQRGKAGDVQQAIAAINKGLLLPIRNEDDRFIRKQSEDLLKGLTGK
jgi:tetratricopeptide (TPR) repeat protein